MYPGKYQDKPGIIRFYEDERGMGLSDSPFMVFLAVILIAFVTLMGLNIAKGFMDVQGHATAVDGAEKIYNAADLLSASTPGATRTLWSKVPEGYVIRFEGGDIHLYENGAETGKLHLDGVSIEGENLPGGVNYHLKLTFQAESGSSRVVVSKIEGP